MTKREFLDTVFALAPNEANAIMDAFDEYVDSNEPHWIPVAERLPEDDTVVLVCGKGGGVYTAIHNNSKTWIRGWWKMNSKNHHCNPVAWMPLPEPYKGVTT
jgi:hypothetical protein